MFAHTVNRSEGSGTGKSEKDPQQFDGSTLAATSSGKHQRESDSSPLPQSKRRALDPGVFPQNDGLSIQACGTVGGAHAQFMPGAQDLSVQSATMNNAGRDIVTNVTNHHYSQYQVPNGGEETVTLEDVLGWLADTTNGFLEVEQKISEERMEGTGMWFTESREFQDFIEGKGTILWGTGPPGAGKTFLSGTSKDELHRILGGQIDVAIAHVFLRHSDDYSARDVYASILCQIIKNRNEASGPLKPHCAQWKKNGRSGTPLKKEAIRLLQAVVSRFFKVFLVVDGLDEASDDVKESLIQELPSMGVNLLIMSRELPMLMALTPQARHVSIQARTHDVDLFVREKIRKSGKLSALLGNDESMIAHLSRKVNEKSQGMFLVAHLQMEAMLRESTTINDLFLSLGRLPSGVDRLYSLAMSRIEDQPTNHASIARRTLNLLLHAQSRLSVTDIQYALATSDGVTMFDSSHTVPESLIVSVCCGLIEVRRHQRIWYDRSEPIKANRKAPGALVQVGDVVQFIHYTAKEYICGIQSPGLPSPHSLLATICVACLEQHLDALQSIPVGAPVLNYLRAPPFLLYAFLYWGVHAQMCLRNDPSMRRELLQFLSACSTFPDQSFRKVRLDVDIKARPFRVSGLHLAAKYGLTDCIAEGSLSYMKDPDYGFTPTHYAAMYDQVECMCALLETYGGLNDLTLRENLTPLHVAVLCRSTPVTQELLYPSHGKDSGLSNSPQPRHSIGSSRISLPPPRRSILVNTKDSTFGRTALMDALKLLHPPKPLVAAGLTSQVATFTLFDTLISHPDINVNVRDNSGNTALIHSTCLGDNSSLEGSFIPLLNHPKVDVNIQGNNGLTALRHATSLYKHYRNWTACRSDPYGRPNSPFPVRASDISRAEVISSKVHHLLSHPDIDPNLPGNDGRTPFMETWYSKDQDQSTELSILASLASRGLPPGSGIPSRHNVLMLAALRGKSLDIGKLSSALITLLNDPTVDVNLENDLKSTALIDAIRGNLQASGDSSIELLSILLSHPKIDVNRQGEGGQTALMVAISSRRPLPVIHHLLSHPRIDPNIKDHEGMSPLLKCLSFSEALIPTSPYLQTRQEVLCALLSHPKLDLTRDSRGRSALMVASSSHLPQVSVPSTLYHPRSNFATFSDDERNGILLTYCAAGEWEFVNHLLGRAPALFNVNARDPYDAMGRTALMLTLLEQVPSARMVATFATILSHPDLDINLRDKAGDTALIYAIKNLGSHQEKLVCALLSHPSIDVNLPFANGQTALMMALCFGGDSSTVQSLLGHPAPVHPTPEELQEGPPLLFPGVPWPQFIDSLPDRREPCLLNVQNDFGRNAFMMAAQLGYERSVASLISRRDLALNQRDEEGDGGLAYAITGMAHEEASAQDLSSRIAILRNILSHPETDVNLQNRHGRTVLMTAIMRITSKCACLPGAGCSHSCGPRDGQKTPVGHDTNGGVAQFLGEVVRILINHRSLDLSVRDSTGRTAMDYGSGRPDILRLFPA